MAAIETPEFIAERVDKLGTPEAYNHYAVGWAHAMCTPYQWTKQVASHWGGTRNGTIVHWPGGIRAAGELRHQFCHVIDVAPTILEAVGLPRAHAGQRDHAGADRGHEHGLHLRRRLRGGRHETEYFEMFCNRGMYHKGWSAVTKHRTPWQTAGGTGIAFDDDQWELYDGANDWSQAHDLADGAARQAPRAPAPVPDPGRALQRPAARRPRLRALPARGQQAPADDHGGTRQILYPGGEPLSEQNLLNWRNKSWSMTAAITVPDGGAATA